MGFEASQLSIGYTALAVVGHRALQQSGGNDLGAAQRRGAFDDERDGDDRREQQRPDGPTSSLKNGEHEMELRKAGKREL